MPDIPTVGLDNTTNLNMANNPEVKVKFSPYEELGNTGLMRFGYYVYEEFLKELSGLTGIRTYKEMQDNDSMIGALLFAIDMLCRGVTWRVEAYSDSNEDLSNALFVEECMNDMSYTWSDTISEIMSMLTYGWSYHEIVYKVRKGFSDKPNKNSRYTDGKIGWSKIAIRAQETFYQWRFADNGDIRGLVQLSPPFYVPTFIPIEKALLFRTTAKKNNPEGRSVLRNAYRSWYFKKNIETIEAIGVERDLAGMPVAFVPPELLSTNATENEKAILNVIKKIVRNIRRDEQEGVVFPLIYDEKGNQMYKLELLSSGGKRNFNTNDIINRYNQSIAMTVLADFILLGHTTVGAYSLGVSKEELFTDAIQTWLNSIGDTFSRIALPRLFKLNNMNLNKLPQIKPNKLNKVNLKELGDYISKLAGSGIVLSDETVDYYLKSVAGLPVSEHEQY